MVLALIAANGFFVVVEFALVAVDRARVERLAAAGDRRSRVVVAVLERLSFHLSGAQLGITITSLVLGFVAEPTVATAIAPAVEALPGVSPARSGAFSVAIALALATFVQMVAGELVPKNWAIARSLQLARMSAPAHRAVCVVFRPLIGFLNSAANWTVRRLGIEPREELRAVRTIEEVDLLVRSSGAEGALDPADAQLVSRSIRFREKTAAEILVPRTSVVSLAADASVTELFAKARHTRRSRFPVVGADLDDVRGVVHVKDGYRVPVAERDSTPVSRIARQPLVVPPSRDLRSLLAEMRSGGSQMAVVVDEYGGTDGILTLEDVLEEIVGDIEDEHDPSVRFLHAPRRPGAAGRPLVLQGRLHRDEVEEACGFRLPEGPFETLAGFVLSELGHIPDPGESVSYAGWRFGVLALDRRRITRIEVVPPGASDDHEGGTERSRP